MAVLPLQGRNLAPGPWEGATPGKDVQVSGIPSARDTLNLEAIISELQGVSVTGTRLLRLKTRAKALQKGKKVCKCFCQVP